jgi:magnesium transporter
MSNSHSKRKEYIGLSPYELKYRGEKRGEKIRMTVFDIKLDEVRELNIESTEQLKEFVDSDSTTWLNVDGLHNEAVMREISALFNIPANIMSDVMDPSLRPQIKDFDNGIFASIKMLEYDEKSNIVKVDNLCLLVMNRLLISFQEEAGDLFDPVRERIRKHKTKIRTGGSDYLAFALLDVVIDHYNYILGVYGEKVETLEERLVLNATGKDVLSILNIFKRELNNLRRDIRPAKEMVMNLVKLDTDYIQDENRTHYRELQENINQAAEMLDYYREVLYDELDTYHSAMSTKLNDIMAVLTIFSVVFIPITFLAGVYGMNFDNIPELHTKYGYFVLWGVMIVIAIFMLIYFKRKKWF